MKRETPTISALAGKRSSSLSTATDAEEIGTLVKAGTLPGLRGATGIDLDRLKTLGSLFRLKVYFLVLVYGLESFHLDRGVVKEIIFPIITGHKTVAFLLVKPLNTTV